jgi:ABC-type uncharacterized transport system permease subunit
MDRNLSGFLIGCVGAAVTLLAYNQTVVTSTQCIAAGFVILLFALGVKEGIISLCARASEREAPSPFVSSPSRCSYSFLLQFLLHLPLCSSRFSPEKTLYCNNFFL